MVWQALCRVARLPQALLHQLLHPQPQGQAPTHPALAACGLPGALLRELQRRHNASQQAAIAAALSGQQLFTLIQACFAPRLCIQARVPLCSRLRQCVSRWEAQDAVPFINFRKGLQSS